MSILSPMLLCCIVVISFASNINIHAEQARDRARESWPLFKHYILKVNKKTNKQASKQTSNGSVDNSNKIDREFVFCFIRKTVGEGRARKREWKVNSINITLWRFTMTITLTKSLHLIFFSVFKSAQSIYMHSRKKCKTSKDMNNWAKNGFNDGKFQVMTIKLNTD